MKLINYSIITVLISIIISACLSVNPHMSFYGCPGRCEGAITLACYFLMYCMVLKHFKTKDFELFSFTIISISFLSCFYALAQLFFCDPYVWKGTFGFRSFSVMSHPAFYGTFLSMSLPFIYHGILKGNKWLYPVLIFVFFTLIETKTRASFLGAIVSGVYFAWFYIAGVNFYHCSYIKINKKFLIYILIGIIILNIVIPNSPIRRCINSPGTINSRIDMWGVGLDMVKRSPVFGIGPDVVSEVYRWQYWYSKDHKMPLRDQNRLHNEFLNIAVERGLVGLFAWVLFLFTYFRVVWKKRYNPITIVLSSSVIAYLVQNMFSFGVIHITLMFWYLVALTLVVGGEEWVK